MPSSDNSLSPHRGPRQAVKYALITGFFLVAIGCFAFLSPTAQPSAAFLIEDEVLPEWPFNPDKPKGQNIYTATLKDSSDPHHYIYWLDGKVKKGDQDIANLQLDLFLVNDNTLRFRLRDRNKSRFEIPASVLPLKEKQTIPPHFTLANVGVQVTLKPFSIRLTLPNNVVLLDTAGQDFVYQDEYLEMGMNLASDDVFGLGERIGDFKLKDGEYAMWSTVRDDGTPDDGTNKGNRQGFHPFFLNRASPDAYLGYYMANVNAQSVVKTGKELSHRLKGGILDFYLFYSNSAHEVVQLYHNIIGKPGLMPYSVINWHLDLQGHSSIKSVNATIQDFIQFYSSHQYLDTYVFFVNFWLGDQALNNHGDPFTLNKQFATIEKAFEGWCKQLSLWMPDCLYYFRQTVASPDNQAYPYYLKNGGVAKNNGTKVQFSLLENGIMHKVTNTSSVYTYPDLRNAQTRTTWKNGLASFLKSSGSRGVCLTYPALNIKNNKLPENDQKYSSFNPGTRPLDAYSLPLSSNQSLGEQENIHNLEQLVAMKTAYEQLQTTQKYPALFTESTAPGMGKYAAYWDMDVPFEEASLKYLVSTTLKFNMYGIPYVGADSCGNVTTSNWNETLCYTWYNLATMLPMSRTGRIAMKNFTQYSFFSNMFYFFTRPFDYMIYTRLVDVSEKGGMAWYPVFFDFAEDQYVENPEAALMISEHMIYFPPLTTATQYSVKLPKNESWWSCSYSCGKIMTPDKADRSYSVYNQQSFKAVVRGQRLYFTKYAKEVRVIFLNEGSNRMAGHFYVPEMKATQEPTRVQLNYINQKVGIHSSRYNMDLNMGQLHSLYIIYPPANSHYNVFGCVLGRDTASSTLTPMSDWSIEFVWADLAMEFGFRNAKATTSKVSLVQFGDFTLNNQNYCYDNYFVKYRIGDLTQRQVGGQAVSYNDTTKVLQFSFTGLQSYTNKNIKLLWFYFDFFGDAATFKPMGVRTDSFGATFGSIPVSQAGLSDISGTTETFKFMLQGEGVQVGLQKMIMDTDFVWYKLRANVTFLGCYGYGERRISTLNLCAQDSLYTLWNNNEHTEGVNEGVSQGRDGSHPVLFFVYSPKPNIYKYFGLFFLNTNAQELKIQAVGNQTDITFISIGGMAEFYFINPTTSFNELIQAYQSIVGKPPLIPLSTLGFHNMAQKPKNTAALRSQVKWYKDSNLPLEGVWLDISYLWQANSFTLAQEFNDLKAFHAELKAANQTLILQLPSNVPFNKSNPAYQLGNNYDVFIKSAVTQEELKGSYYGGSVVYPEFASDKSIQVWIELMSFLEKDLVTFDGIWLIDNHHYNLCDGECPPTILKSKEESELDEIRWNITYKPPQMYPGLRSLSLDAKHNLTNANYMIERHLHNLNGLLQMRSTSRYFIQQSKRNFVISDSTFAGAGEYGYHIVTRVSSTFESLQMAVSDLLNFNLFGMPMVGTELCGEFGPTNNMKEARYQADLCNRWLQLAVFYPMVVNKRTAEAPSALEGLDMNSVKYALQFRYGLVRYIYTQFFQVHLMGGAVYRPVFFEFNEDPNKFTETHFMIGKDMLVTAVLNEGATNVTDYIPAGKWAHVFNGTIINSKGEKHTIPVDEYSILAHIREGSIIPTQDTFNGNISSTQNLLHKPIELRMLPNTNATVWADGTLIYDDGVEAQFRVDTGDYEGYRFSFKDYQLDFVRLSQTPSHKKDAILGDIWIYDWSLKAPKNVTVTQDGGKTVIYKSEVVAAKKALHIVGQGQTYSDIISVKVNL